MPNKLHAMHQKIKAFELIIKEVISNHTWSVVIISIVGIISLITILAMLFLPIGSGPANYKITGGSIPAAGSPQFNSYLSSVLNLPLEKGNTIEILNNGDEFMKSFLQSIDDAHSSINIMVYIWNDGKMSDEILSHVEKKLSEGVEVRIVLDGVGGQFASMKKFKEAGGQVITFHSLSPLPRNLTRVHRRNHRRSIVIDGKIGYIGGMAVDDKWLGNAENKDHWRDMMFKVSGSMTSHLQGAFAELWTQSGQLLAGDKFYPPITNPGNTPYIPLASSPTTDVLSLQKYFLASFVSAQKSIYITSPYFLLDSALSNALEQKAKDGVDVRVLVPNELTDAPGVRNASRFSYEKFLKAGVKIYEYQPTFNHTKSLVIDGKWTVIGSANMDNRSRMLNEENIFGVADASFANQMEKVFMDNIEKSQEIKLSEWQKRGAWEKIREVFAIKFIEQY
jgi:cardiolipin synthase